MSYSVYDINNNILLARGTLEEAREAVIKFTNRMDFTRKELGSKEIVSTYDGDGGILEEKHISKIEDIDERIVFAIIQHNSVGSR